MRAWSLAAVVAVAAAAGVPASGAARDARSLPPPSVHASTAWLSSSSGPTDPTKALPQLFIVTRAPAHPRPPLPLSISGGLRQLAPTGALIWASTASRGHYDHFKYDAWPPRLSHFRIDRAWEGQPQLRIQQRPLWFTSHGWSSTFVSTSGRSVPRRLSSPPFRRNSTASSFRTASPPQGTFPNTRADDGARRPTGLLAVRRRCGKGCRGELPVVAHECSEANDEMSAFTGRRDLQPCRGWLALSLLSLTRRRIVGPGQVRLGPSARL